MLAVCHVVELTATAGARAAGGTAAAISGVYAGAENDVATPSAAART